MPNQSEQVATIMVVDDTPANLKLLEGMLLEKKYRVLSFPNGKLAIKTAQKSIPDLLLLDINMPDMDGYEVCRCFKEDSRLREVPIVFISGLNETANKVLAFTVGGVDYITKPFQIEEVHARVGTHLKMHRMQQELEEYNRSLEEQVKTKVHEIIDSQMATIFAMAKLVESRDDDTGKHIERVQLYCRTLAEQLFRDSTYQGDITPLFIENIYLASPLHDIGKVAILDSILLKPGKHTPEEFEIMKSHTIIGAENMQSVYNEYPENPFIGMGIEIALYHHERWDGKGYPDGMIGRNIPLSARIMAVADCYDAIRSDRCYRKGLEHEVVAKMLQEEQGTHFDPVIIEAFLAVEDTFSHIMDTETYSL